MGTQGLHSLDAGEALNVQVGSLGFDEVDFTDHLDSDSASWDIDGDLYNGGGAISITVSDGTSADLAAFFLGELTDAIQIIQPVGNRTMPGNWANGPAPYALDTWNTASTEFCGINVEKSTMDNVVWFGISTNCQKPNFILDLIKKINNTDPDVVCISLQESKKPGSYLMSHTLPFFMHNIPNGGYELLGRTRMMGVGELAVRGIRISLFIEAILTILSIGRFPPKAFKTDRPNLINKTLPNSKVITAKKSSLAKFIKLQFVTTLSVQPLKKRYIK